MSASTPVLWVTKPSTYKCVISQSGNFNKCFSANICVHVYSSTAVSQNLYLVLDEEEGSDCKITRVDVPVGLTNDRTLTDSYIYKVY